jgi:repressor LexA
MDDSPKLTARQQQILDLVQSAIERTGAPPTRAEIAAELGFRSANAAEEHLQALARKGVIELVGGTSRGIRLKSDAARAQRGARGKQYSAAAAEPGAADAAAGGPRGRRQPHPRAGAHRPDLRGRSPHVPRRPDYLLKVRGMSMRDAGILDGDLLAVQKANDAKNGQIVVARLGDDVTVKRCAARRQGIELIPENPDFQTIVVPVRTQQPTSRSRASPVGLIRNTMLM